MYENDMMKPITMHVNVKVNLQKRAKQAHTHPEGLGKLSVGREGGGLCVTWMS